MSAPTIEIRPIDLLDPEQDAEARAWIAVHQAAREHAMGEGESTWTLAEIHAFHRAGEKRRVVRGAWRAGELVGALEVIMPLRENTSLAYLWLSVSPGARGGGVGSALYAEAERIARDHGRTLLHTQTVGVAGRDDEGEAFARRHDFEIAMTDLRGSMRLEDALESLGALLSGGDDYELESYVDDMPTAWLADRALLQQRMMTDMPLGDLKLEAEVWDARRIEEENARWRAAGRRIVETVARHRPSGHLVGFTQISVAGEEPTLGHQEDTLVLAEHRGHGLGLRLKAANALLLHETMPEVTVVRTWNADDNGPMLAVNRRLGYVVDGYSRNWQKTLT